MFGIDDAITAGLGIINKFIPDKTAAAQAAAEYQLAVLKANTDAAQGQLDTNKTEAASTNWFVAGARPSIMWICSGALAYQYLLVPIAVWAALWSGHTFPTPPTLYQNLWQLMMGMLGLGGLRTFEKMNGVQSKH